MKGGSHHCQSAAAAAAALQDVSATAETYK